MNSSIRLNFILFMKQKILRFHYNWLQSENGKFIQIAIFKRPHVFRKIQTRKFGHKTEKSNQFNFMKL